MREELATSNKTRFALRISVILLASILVLATKIIVAQGIILEKLFYIGFSLLIALTTLVRQNFVSVFVLITTVIFTSIIFIGLAAFSLLKVFDFVKNSRNLESRITKPSRYNLLKFSALIFSEKTQKETFETAMADWDFEIFEALKKNKDTKLFMINLRNTYAFLMVMWQKSPIGDLIEFIRKFAK